MNEGKLSYALCISVRLGPAKLPSTSGRWQAGALASVFSVIVSDIFFLPPTWASTTQRSGMGRVRAALLIDNPSDWIRLIAFASTAFVICLLAALIVIIAGSLNERVVKAGDTAPDFELPVRGKETVRLSAALQKGPIVLLTYVLDFSPG